jgi:penicillin-binding protein 1A
VGYDDRLVLGKGETGAMAALPIWMAFMKEALKDVPPEQFEPPKPREEGSYIPVVVPAFRPPEPQDNEAPAQGPLPTSTPAGPGGDNQISINN